MQKEICSSELLSRYVTDRPADETEVRRIRKRKKEQKLVQWSWLMPEISLGEKLILKITGIHCSYKGCGQNCWNCSLLLYFFSFPKLRNLFQATQREGGMMKVTIITWVWPVASTVNDGWAHHFCFVGCCSETIYCASARNSPKW